MSKTLLETLNSPNDLRRLAVNKLPQVAQELRDFIIDTVSIGKGHLGASLGSVEITLALHYFFNTPSDKIVWDVGHQAYSHKILTGRRNLFKTNRELHGISGFPKRDESEYDIFGTGHSSTSISAALGMAIASKLQNKTNEHIAVIGDAAIASGMAFEALNHAGSSNINIWIILNDNAMGIDPSVGALKEHLNTLKASDTNSDKNIFTALNFHYTGSIDGHNITTILEALNDLKKLKAPKIIHLKTIKGKGLKPAEEDQIRFHAPGKFDKFTGKPLTENNKNIPPKFQDVFGKTLVELAEKNPKIVAVTPAMPTGSSLNFMMKTFPDRCFDVGIAEQHAVTFSAGLAAEGSVVFCAIYSTFLQRAYDQAIHDVALQNLPVIFCIDRAGLVGEDGPTHHGVFDIAYLRSIPNMQIAAPADEIELRNLLYTVSKEPKHPIAIRYPRGRGQITDWQIPFSDVEIGKGHQLKKGNSIAVLSIGPLKNNVAKAINKLNKGNEIAHYDMRFVKPLDKPLLLDIFKTFQTIITVEDGVKIGGFGDAVIDFANVQAFMGKIIKLGISDEFIPHGSVSELYELVGLSTNKIAKTIQQVMVYSAK